MMPLRMEFRYGLSAVPAGNPDTCCYADLVRRIADRWPYCTAGTASLLSAPLTDQQVLRPVPSQYARRHCIRPPGVAGTSSFAE